MKNFVQAGATVQVPAPYPLTSGQGALVGSLFGVAATDAANGADVNLVRTGVFDIAAVTLDVGAVGTKMYWDNAAKRLTITLTGNTLVGCLVAAKSGTDTTARVLLDGAVR